MDLFVIEGEGGIGDARAEDKATVNCAAQWHHAAAAAKASKSTTVEVRKEGIFVLTPIFIVSRTRQATFLPSNHDTRLDETDAWVLTSSSFRGVIHKRLCTHRFLFSSYQRYTKWKILNDIAKCNWPRIDFDTEIVSTLPSAASALP